MKDFLVVRKSEVGVFGYKAGVLESITNESPRAVRFTICTTPGESECVVLQEKETRELNIDIWKCIRERFMPHVEAESDTLLSVQWKSEDIGSALPCLHIGSDASDV